MIFDRTCPQCKKQYTPELIKVDCLATHAKVRSWQNGSLVQNVWPKATNEQREQLMTGICSNACWEAFLS